MKNIKCILLTVTECLNISIKYSIFVIFVVKINIINEKRIKIRQQNNNLKKNI